MTASTRNWTINWLRSAPTALRMPVSIARWAARAVIRATKLNEAEAMHQHCNRDEGGEKRPIPSGGYRRFT